MFPPPEEGQLAKLDLAFGVFAKRKIAKFHLGRYVYFIFLQRYYHDNEYYHKMLHVIAY